MAAKSASFGLFLTFPRALGRFVPLLKLGPSHRDPLTPSALTL
jgi:hypothetical protein